MSTYTSSRYLQAVGELLIALGFVHLAATPHTRALLRGSPLVVYEQAIPLVPYGLIEPAICCGFSRS
jgi:hypothetical protein